MTAFGCHYWRQVVATEGGDDVSDVMMKNLFHCVLCMETKCAKLEEAKETIQA